MKNQPWLVVASLAALAGSLTSAAGQQSARTFSVGYVYPAGAKQGTTTEHVIAGQFIRDVQGIEVTGGGVAAEIIDMIRPISGSELNQIRIQVDALMAKRAVSRNDEQALQNFRSFKNAKDIKSEASKDEIDELKKKYAGATWTREDEQLLAELRKKMATGVRRPANPAISELVVCRLTVSPDARPIPRELRLRTAQGLSNPVVFYVGQWEEYSDEPSKNIAEEKSAVAKTAVGPKGGGKKDAAPFELPGVINGQILPGEVDRWRFEAKKGSKLVVSVKARQLIPYISDAVPGWFQATLALLDSEGRELAYRDDFRFDPDPVLHYEIPADGAYVIEIKDSIFRGREDFVYRVTVGETPFIGTIFPLGGPAGAVTNVEVRGWNLQTRQVNFDGTGKQAGTYPLCVSKDGQFSNFVLFDLDTLPERPAATPGTMQALTLPVIVNGRIAKPNDDALFSFEGKAGQRVVAEVMARRLNSPLDSVLALTDPDGKELAFNDDNLDRSDGLTTHQADSYLNVTLPKDGTYRLLLSDAQHRGATDYVYRLRVSAPRPDFELRAVPSSLNVRAGTSVPLTVHALRRDGFAGEIAIRLKSAPDGFVLGGARIPANEETGKLTLTVPWRAQERPASIELEGTAEIEGREVTRKVVPAEDRMQAFAYRHLVPSQDLCVAVLGGKSSSEADIRIASQTPVRIPAGGTIIVKFASASNRAMMKARIALAEAPEGVSIKDVARSKEGLELTLESDASKVKPGLKGNLLVSASPPTSNSLKNKRDSLSAVRMLPAIPFEITGK